MRYVDESALDDIALGSTILASGGGGDPYIGKLLAREEIRKHGPAELVDVGALDDDARVVFLAGLGAPGALVEKLPRTEEILSALRALEHHIGKPFTHLAPAEAGGFNALVPFAAVSTKLPILDADGMGRAFPAIELVTPTIFGGSASPAAMTDEHGNSVIISSTTNAWTESMARAVGVASGAVVMMALYPMSGAEAKQWLIRGVLTLAQTLGELVRTARAEHRSPVHAVVEHSGGTLLFEGKVVDVERENTGGWTVGVARVAGTGGWEGRWLELRFQNENLIALVDGVPVATTPDLITVLAQDDGEPIPAEEMKFGYRISVVGIPCDSRWRTEAGLALVGPKALGYDVEFEPVDA